MKAWKMRVILALATSVMLSGCIVINTTPETPEGKASESHEQPATPKDGLEGKETAQADGAGDNTPDSTDATDASTPPSQAPGTPTEAAMQEAEQDDLANTLRQWDVDVGKVFAREGTDEYWNDVDRIGRKFGMLITARTTYRKVAVLRTDGQVRIAGKTSEFGQVISRLGLTNATDTDEGAGADGYIPITPDQLTALQPDAVVLIKTTPRYNGRETLVRTMIAQDAAWGQVPAIAHGDWFELPFKASKPNYPFEHKMIITAKTLMGYIRQRR